MCQSENVTGGRSDVARLQQNTIVLAPSLNLRNNMNVYENRLASFNNSNVKWPYSKTKRLKANPETLAHAGFYYTPTRILPPNDNVTCFSCAKQLDGWQSNDDPFTEHASHSPTCAWCVLGFPTPPRAGGKKKKPVHVPPRLTVDAADPETWPASERMIEARIASFGSSWPHEGKTGWAAVSVQMMASAGFHYTPTPDTDDEAACVYCELHLDGWAKEDDPIQEHHKREPTCSFFINFASLTITTAATAAVPSVALVTVPAAKQGSKPAKAPRGRRKKVVEEEAVVHETDTQTDAGSETVAETVAETEEERESEQEARPARGRKKVGAGRRKGRQPKEQGVVMIEREMEENTIMDALNTKKFPLDDDDVVSTADTDIESIPPIFPSPSNNGKKKTTRPTRRVAGRDTGPADASARRESMGSEASVMTLAESVVNEAVVNEAVVNEATEPARRGRRPGRGAAKVGARMKSETDATAAVDKMTEWDKDPLVSDRSFMSSLQSLPALPTTAITTTTTIPPLLAQRIEPILSTTLAKSAPPQPIVITDEEWSMTVEEYMDRLVEKQVERLNEEARRMMGVFVGEAEKIARAIDEGK